MKFPSLYCFRYTIFCFLVMADYCYVAWGGKEAEVEAPSRTVSSGSHEASRTPQAVK